MCASDPGERRRALASVAAAFLKIGLTGFGGPAAHVAMMHEEVVRRRKWLSKDEFLDLLGATNLIPGPNSTEMAAHVGYRRAGWAGLIVGGCGFVLPATLIVTACAWAYVRYGSLPQAAALLYGVKPVIIAIVLRAFWDLSRTAIKNNTLAAICLAGVVACFAGTHELVVLLLAGLATPLAYRAFHRNRGKGSHAAGVFAAGPLSLLAAGAGAASGAAASPGLWALFLFFLKVGSVLYGSGYVLLAFFRGDLVVRWRWLTESQLLDAIAIGQVTPGPLFTAATFIGYVLCGFPGAMVCTLGMFLPSFLFVAASGPLIPRIRRSRAAAAVLDGVNAASLALMIVVTVQLARAALVDVPTAAAALASMAVLLRFRVNPAWLVAGGAAMGLMLGGH